MKDYSIKYLDKSYFVDDKTLEICTSDYDKTKIHPKDLEEDLTEILGIDADLALIVINEWMYSKGITKLTDRWEAVRIIGTPNPMVIAGINPDMYTSVSMGMNCIVSGQNSIAIGMNAQALGDNSIAIGYGAVAREGQICINTHGNNQNNTGDVIFNGRTITSYVGEAINHSLNIHPYE